MRNEIQVGMREFTGWILRLFRQPVFLFVTFWGHLSILAGAACFHYFETSANPKADSFFSAYYWAISTAMTVGSADISPVTLGGKITSIALMMTGSLFLWSYAALFAASAVLPTVRRFSREVEELEADVQEMEKEVRLDKATVERLVRELERLNHSRKGVL
jgi:hypothetical protein